jgi:hypothetical protein
MSAQVLEAHAAVATTGNAPAPEILTPHQIALYAREGMLNAGQVLTMAEVEVLRAELERVLRDQHDPTQVQPFRLSNLSGDPERPVWQVVNIWMASEAFRDLLHRPRIVGVVQQATGARELRLWHDQIQYKPAERGGVNPWHQDNPYWAPLAPAGTQITAWLALDDVDDDNGCMSMVPGSHLWGDAIPFLHALKDFHDLPTAYQGHDVHVVRTPVRAGCLHLHHPYTWHGSHANRSGRPRRAIALHFMTDGVQLVPAKRRHHILGATITSGDHEPVDGPLFLRVFPTDRAQRPSLASVAQYRDSE